MSSRSRLLFVTDLTYQASGRRYCDEDIFLSSELRDEFDVALCHPRDAGALMKPFDAVIIRNSGPVMNYQASYEAFRAEAVLTGSRIYNPLTGHGDMAGKQYLVELTNSGFPVIPTVDRLEHLPVLPEASHYVVKPKAGADSAGLEILTRQELTRHADQQILIQPHINIQYEVSFYYIDDVFQYALKARSPQERWVLDAYSPDHADLDFARRFIDWNALDYGIQRVDACRTQDGSLLLVELEDLNPYLSLDRVHAMTRDAFVTTLKSSLRRVIETPPQI